MNYVFPPRLAELVHRKMASGHYDSTEQLLTDALIALDAIECQDAALKAEVRGRIATADNSGPVDFESLKAEARRRAGL